ncbi:hypothetical protein OPKNFCMD_4274 [Methylobacterium crusticola]|uniref:Uncharacterized protein n=1 Tax=Methylobacterium crusticola TaxID=1697972 RepID=A0ABQ4R2Y6_9HYPH|nr:hypothetical protein [Methylobacterium crusticola]GJD51519.1 hypothetical protein OPKNFCMD_4274 [Methylobacterium crusticola]
MQASQTTRIGDAGRDAAADLEQSVAATLRTIAAVQAERVAPPVRSARLTLATLYGVSRLQRRLERERELPG